MDPYTSTRAVFFDFGGTLFDYRTVAEADLASQTEALGWAGIECDPEAVRQAFRKTMREVFHRYLPRPFYLHHDLFRDALAGLFEQFDAPCPPEYYERYRIRLMQRYRQDLQLREGLCRPWRPCGGGDSTWAS